ncbi:single-stranded DNA-binding protein [Neolewinella antarctica]|uniref:Single-stranded DNA-binding protein n=1 Tax=Neolewinella antarctica TaxID=442734 RepID=A0ABX0XE44_9BACT|nr:single-stranded DNA-binding protein [Neolewinella antarctica]NJC27472.1 single-strand DNA-binding protein [Neolewinella antarctica]
MNVRNYIHLTGNLGADPTTAILPSGDLVCNYNLATNEYYRDKAGKRVTRTEWHSVKAYGKLAEIFAEHLKKGSQISVVGNVRYAKWEDKFGQKRTTANVIAREFTFLGSGRKDKQEAPDHYLTDDAPTMEYGEHAVDAMDAEIEAIINESATATAAKPRSAKKTGTRRTKGKATAA